MGSETSVTLLESSSTLSESCEFGKSYVSRDKCDKHTDFISLPELLYHYRTIYIADPGSILEESLYLILES